MTNSPAAKNNPTLYAFLPIFYTVWSDAVLTPSELEAIKSHIEKQPWLTADEQSALLSFLDLSAPPSPDQLKQWQEQIRNATGQLDLTGKESLTEIGLKIATLHTNNNQEHKAEVRDTLQKIEDVLGVISRESTLNFRSVKREVFSEKHTGKPKFDPLLLGSLLDGPNAPLIEKVKKIISDPVFNYYQGESMTEYREQVLEWCRHLARQGFGAMAYPEKYGGQNNMAGYFSVMETLSYHDLSTVIKFGVQFGLFGMSIYFLGTEKHHQKYLRSIGTLELPGCFAMTETGHGSNVKGIETTATYNVDSKTFTIHTPTPQARKEYIGNAAMHGKMATVFAKLILNGKDYGVNAFLVPLRDDAGQPLKGITIEDCGRKMGLNGVDNGIIHFHQVEIPKDNMLDRFADVTNDGKFTSPISSDNRRFFTMLGTLVGGRIGIPRSGLSATKSGLTIAIRYGDDRRQFGPENSPEIPILNYKTHQRRLMPLLANSYALHFALEYVTQRYLTHSDDEVQEIEALAAGLKAFTTWNTTHTLQVCRECCGGKGYLSENRIDALKNDTDVYTTFEGDNTVLMQLVAKSRLTEFRQEFSNMNFFGILNYVIDQAKTSIQEMNPITVRNTDKEHLLDPEFHLNAFRYRERDILTSAARRLKKHIENGMDSFDAFNQTQYHLLNVGFAYVERVVLEQFMLKVERTEDPGCRAILKKLCDLFALSQIEKNKGWYLEHDYMTGVKTKAVRRMVNELCWDIRQDAVALTDVFRIPDGCLAAPIAR